MAGWAWPAGAQQELDQWPVLLELACLLPDLAMHIILVSPWVPQRLDGQSALFAGPGLPRCRASGCSCEHAQSRVGPLAPMLRFPRSVPWAIHDGSVSSAVCNM